MVVGAGLAGPAPSAVGAPPAVTVTPPHGAPGTAYSVVVTCAVEPTAMVIGEYDDVPGSATFIEGPAGTWTATGIGGTAVDTLYSVVCAGERTEDRFDTDVPRMFFGPYFGPFGSADPPTEVIGKDCPDGTTPTVEVGVSDVSLELHPTTDQYGDWSVALPASSATEGATVHASCGDVTYPALHRAPTETTTSTTSTSTTTSPTEPGASNPPPAVAPAVPAAVQPGGTSHFTG